jgi:hypothetical protein
MARKSEQGLDPQAVAMGTSCDLQLEAPALLSEGKALGGRSPYHGRNTAPATDRAGGLPAA